MIKKGALLFSYFFHPILLPTLAMAAIIFLNPYLFANLTIPGKFKIIGVALLNTFLFPLFVIFLMRKLDFISSYHLFDQKERILPYIGVSFFFVWSYFVFKYMNLHPIVNIMMLGACIAAFMGFFFNIFVKISMHTIGMGSMLALFLLMTSYSNYNLQEALMLIILIAGIIGTSRLILNAHEDLEIYGGYVIGFFAQMLAFIILA